MAAEDDAGLYAPLCGDDNLQRWEVVGQLLDHLLGETSSKISYFCTLNEKLMLFFSLGRPRTPVVLVYCSITSLCFGRVNLRGAEVTDV